MATLYVENVPDELYEALRERARAHRKSIASEVLLLLEQSVPTPAEFARRREALRRALRLRSRRAGSPGPFPTSEQMQREDRLR